MDELLKAMTEVRPFIDTFPKTHKWIWSEEEIKAFDVVLEAVLDCTDITK